MSLFAKSDRGYWFPVELPTNSAVHIGADLRDPVDNSAVTHLFSGAECPDNPPEPKPVVIHREPEPKPAKPEVLNVSPLKVKPEATEEKDYPPETAPKPVKPRKPRAGAADATEEAGTTEDA